MPGGLQNDPRHIDQWRQEPVQSSLFARLVIIYSITRGGLGQPDLLRQIKRAD